MTDRQSSDRSMLDGIKARLDQSTEELDERTLRALKVARHEALAQQDRPSKNWWPVTGLAAFAGIALLVVGLVTIQFNDSVMLEEVEDLPMLTAGDDLELYENLEFYQWLVFEEQTG